MPTARAVAQKLGLRRPVTKGSLSNPRLNVRLGAAYLRELLDRFDGSEPLALAAYNAGPTAVSGWLSRRVRPIEGVAGPGLAPAPDELVEEIPVDETRNYVKTVLARARGYARLLAPTTRSAAGGAKRNTALAQADGAPAEDAPALEGSVPSALRE